MRPRGEHENATSSFFSGSSAAAATIDDATCRGGGRDPGESAKDRRPQQMTTVIIPEAASPLLAVRMRIVTVLLLLLLFLRVLPATAYRISSPQPPQESSPFRFKEKTRSTADVVVKQHPALGATVSNSRRSAGFAGATRYPPPRNAASLTRQTARS